MKVLQILPTLNRCGGVESYVMNYYREALKKNIVFDFMINNIFPYKKNDLKVPSFFYIFTIYTIKYIFTILN